jgi:hypothetical protein
LIELLPIYRKRINASDSISDQDLLCALCDYSKPVAIAPAIGKFADGEQLRTMREALDPDIAECCTDEDIRLAVNQPNGPLMASGLCRIQTLARDLRLLALKAPHYPNPLHRSVRTADGSAPDG